MNEGNARVARRIAGIEVNALTAAGTLPSGPLRGAHISKESTPVHDLTGDVLFHRIPIVREREQVAYVDIAVNEVLGDPLVAVSFGLPWNPSAIVGEAREHARDQGLRVDKADEVRFVDYSHPKVAIQFLRDGEELAMIEWQTWRPVPTADERSDGRYQQKPRRPLEPSNFERWSLVEELPDELREQRADSFRRRLANLQEFQVDLDVYRIEPHDWVPKLTFKLVDTRDIDYSLRAGDHQMCYELRGQETSVWCVGASVQMLLDFYRYAYTQVRLAQELGLGTLANPNGLPYARVADVVTAIEALTSNGLDATMITNPGFSTFKDEIRANRPLISFVPGHSRTVAGYTESLIAPINSDPYRGLLVYDPWPPNAGVITRWENFATQTYQYAYTAEVGTIP